MRHVLPDADERDVYGTYYFLTGAFTYSIGQTGRVDALSDGLVSTLDFIALNDQLVTTLAAGIRALCSRQPGS